MHDPELSESQLAYNFLAQALYLLWDVRTHLLRLPDPRSEGLACDIADYFIEAKSWLSSHQEKPVTAPPTPSSVGAVGKSGDSWSALRQTPSGFPTAPSVTPTPASTTLVSTEATPESVAASSTPTSSGGPRPRLRFFEGL